MNGFVETFRTCLMHVSLGVLTFALTALAVRALWLTSRETLGRLAAALRGMPLLVRMMAVVVLGNLIVYGSTKAPGGGYDGAGGGGDDGGDDGGSAMCLSLDDDSSADPVDTGFTAEDVERGFVLVGTGSGELWDLGMPDGASAVESWLRRGASEDIARIAPGLAVFSDGRIAAGSRILAPLNATLGIVPAANWPLLTEGSGPSLIWYGATGPSSFGIGWRNVLLGRNAAAAGSFGAEFFRDGRIVFKYAGIPDGVLTNVFIGALSPAGSLEVAGEPGLTSVRLHTVEPEDLTVPDRDGDGLSTYDEIHLYGTDPGCADTDGDGVPDGEEVALGGDPLVRNAADSEILARVARQAADTAFGAEAWVVEGELSSSALWGGFAASVSIGVDSGTNVLYERTIPINPRGGWTRHFLSARPGEAHGWWLEGLRLEWSDDAGGSGCVTESPRKDSLHLAVSPDATALTIRLVATEAHVRSPQPVWLLAYTPRFEVTGGLDVPLADGTTAHVFTNAAEAASAVTVDRSLRPSRAALLEVEPGGEACRVPEGSGVWPVKPWEREDDSVATGRAAVRWGDRIVVTEPSMTYGVAHSELGNPGYPYDTSWLLDGWWRTSEGLWRCGCAPEISWGGFDDPYITATVTTNDGARAEGTLAYYGSIFWIGSADHLVSGTTLDPHRVCSCPPGCAHCSCKRPDGVSHGSVRFRLSLGEPVAGQVAGFVWFESEGPLAVTPGAFSVTGRGDAVVSDVTEGTERCVSATGGRSVTFSAVTNGVVASVSEDGGTVPVCTWEISNVGGDPSIVRFVERDGTGAVASDETWSCVADDGGWRWDSVDNLAVPVVREGWTEADGSTNVVFDASGRIVSLSEISADGSVTNLLRTISYDAAGRMVLVDDGAAGSVSLSYDAEGRLASVTGPDGTRSFSYGEDGSIVSVDESLWNGEPFDGGVPALARAMGRSAPRRFTAEEAWDHYLGRSGTPGEPLVMPFEAVNTDDVKPTDFKAVREILKVCPAPGDYPVVATNRIMTAHPVRLILGEIGVRLTGTLTVREGCAWEFSGTLTGVPELYDFNASSRFTARGLLSWIASLFKGTDYYINFDGEKPVSARGGCGGSAAR